MKRNILNFTCLTNHLNLFRSPSIWWPGDLSLSSDCDSRNWTNLDPVPWVLSRVMFVHTKLQVWKTQGPWSDMILTLIWHRNDLFFEQNQDLNEVIFQLVLSGNCSLRPSLWWRRINLANADLISQEVLSSLDIPDQEFNITGAWVTNKNDLKFKTKSKNLPGPSSGPVQSELSAVVLLHVYCPGLSLFSFFFCFLGNKMAKDIHKCYNLSIGSLKIKKKKKVFEAQTS